MAPTKRKDARPFRGKGTFLELLDELQDLAAQTLMRHGCPDASARDGAQEFRDQIAALWGGQNIYIPKDTVTKAHEIWAQIIAEFDGTNVRALSRKWRLTEAQIYRILKRDRDERRAENPLPAVG